MLKLIKAHPARIYALVVALLPLVAHFLPNVPTEAVLGAVVAVLGLGEAVQRTENTKTDDAYWTDPFKS
ncbi:hypothetical protein [Streptomyces sp. SP17KL33]|uniref:hypothetical protein n=1 Tax=Streptomyces sp. SP17KL33 TaxID=3002534 RepID=UPI002E7A9A7B|nr:hypothetical protein [Streptomyces sp. SP17KL33]MEE1835767.1 hypothetical protein [Streptomyces sp. SP17KL33]